MDIINTPFFKHLFLDAYVLKSDGYLTDITCEIFSKYLQKNHISNEFTKIFNHNEIYEDYIVTTKTKDYYYDNLLDICKNPQLFKTYREFYLLSGYRSSTGGHSIIFYILKNEDESYTISLINSGEGLEMHPTFLKGGGDLDENLNPNIEHTIILQYNNISFETIIDLIKFTYLTMSPSLNDIKRDLSRIGEPFIEIMIKKIIFEKKIRELYIDTDDLKIKSNTKDRMVYLKSMLEERKESILSEFNEYKVRDDEKPDNFLKEKDIINIIFEEEKEHYINDSYKDFSKFLIEKNEFNFIKNNVDITFFYNYIRNIIPNFNTPDNFYNDKPQQSSSCSFFSAYYLIKYFIFHPRINLFNRFINQIKLDLIRHIKENISTNEFIDINQINACLVLIKDYDLSETLKYEISQLKTIIYKLYENNFSSPTNIDLLKEMRKEYDILTLKFVNEYNTYKSDISFSSYNTFIRELFNYREDPRDYGRTNSDTILYNYFLFKSTILLINDLKSLKITTQAEFTSFFDNIRRLCRILKDEENIYLPDIKLLLLEQFLKMIEDFKIEYDVINILDEANIKENRELIFSFLEVFKIEQFFNSDFNFEYIFDTIKNKLELFISSKYFNIDNNGEFLYLLGFNKENERLLNKYKTREEVEENSRNYQSNYDYSDYGTKYLNLRGGSNLYSFNYSENYKRFKTLQSEESIVDKQNIIDLEYTDLYKLADLINAINANNLELISIKDIQLVHTESNNINILNEEKDNNNYYEIKWPGYKIINKNQNIYKSYCIPLLIQNLNIEKFITVIDLLDYFILEQLLLLLYIYRKDDFIKYKIIDKIPSDSILKNIINGSIHLLLFYDIGLINDDEVTLFINNLNTKFTRRQLGFFIYYSFYKIGFEIFNDELIIDNIQTIFNKINKIDTNIKNGYEKIDSRIFRSKSIILKNTTSSEQYYKNIKQDFLTKINYDYYYETVEKEFLTIKFTLISEYLIKNKKLESFITNIKLISSILTWETKDKYLIELIDFNKSLHVLYNSVDDTFIFYENSEEYNIITNYNKIQGMLIFDSPNTYLLSKDNSSYLLLFNSQKYFDVKLKKDNYWVNESLTKIYNKESYNIFLINNNLVTFNIKNEDYIPLMNSFLINKNNFGINLIIDNFKNAIISSNIVCDVPFVRLFDNKLRGTKTLNDRFEYSEIIKPTINIHLSEVNACNIDKINKISDKINEIKNIEYAEKTEIINSQEALKLYISEYRSNCKTDKYIELKKFIDDIIIIEEEIDYITEIFEDLVFSKKIHSFSSLYIKHYNHFYNILINTLYLKCIAKLKTLKEYNCAEILKNIELLDYNEIYSFEKNRTIEHILFEIHTNYFIKKEQYELVNNQILKDEVHNKVYEILMGKGKTTTITPLILIHQIFNTSTKNYNIILPEHLVPSSFDIIIKYAQLFYEYKIKLNIENIRNNNVISIVSDTTIKKYILNNIKSNVKLNSLFNQDNLFIFDEIDTLIDSNKSDLNMPIDEISHPDELYIIENILNIIFKYYNKKPITYVEDNIFSIKMDSTIKKVTTMIYNQNYGFGELKYDDIKDIEKNKNNFVAIPYSANNTPVYGSEFTDYELSISLTILSYLYNGLRPEDLFILLRYFISFLSKNIELKMFLPTFITEKNVNSILKVSTFRNDVMLQWCKLNIDEFKYNKDFIKFYLEMIILKRYFKISSSQYNISMIDIFDYNICNKKIAFSGTVNFYLLNDVCNNIVTNKEEFKETYPKFTNNLFSTIIPDIKSKGSIYSAIYGITTISSTVKKYDNTLDYDEIETTFIDFILQKTNLINYDAIIDSAGLIINVLAEELIHKIYEKMQEYNIDKILLFINKNSKKMIYYSPTNIKEYNNDIISNPFIYYDHKHTIGIDFKQPSKMHGLVSVSKNSTLTQIAQGIFRLRNINIGHSIDFYSYKKEPINSLLKNLIKNDEIYKLGTKDNINLQFLKFLYRYIEKNKEGYLERIYYDLTKYNDTFLSINEFINQIVINPIQEKIKDKKIKLNTFEYNNQGHSNIHIQLKTNIDIEENIEIRININTQKSSNSFSYYFDIHLEEYSINLDNIDNNKNYFLIDKEKTRNNFNLLDWTFYVSLTYYRLAETYEEKTKVSLYYMYNTKIPYQLTMLNCFDFIEIIKNYKASIDKYNDIIIFNEYGDIIFQKNMSIKVDIPNYIKILIFKIQLPFIDTFHYFLELKENINIELINFFFKGKNSIRNYNINIILDQVREGYYNIKNILKTDVVLDENDFNTWKNLFYLPELTEKQKVIFTEKIIKEYIKKYKIPSIPVSLPQSSPLTVVSLPQATPEVIKPIKVSDSNERFKTTRRELKDTNDIKLYDNYDFRRYQNGKFNALGNDGSIIEIKINKNRLNLGATFTIKQKVLNILAFNNHTDIKLINFTKDSFTFISNGKPGEFIIYLNDNTFKNKYLKYKSKYLQLLEKVKEMTI